MGLQSRPMTTPPSIITDIQKAAASGNTEIIKNILVSADPSSLNSGEELKGMGILACQLGLVDEALGFFTQGLCLSPGDAGLLNNLGHIHFLKGRSEDARLSFDQASKAAPRDVPIRYNLGLANEACNRTADARKIYESIHITHPEHVDSLVRLALIAERDLDSAALENLSKKAMRLDPTHEGARFVNVLVLKKMGKIDDALQHIESLIETHTDRAIYHYERAGLLEKKSEYAGALKNFDTANELSDKRIKTHQQYNATVTALKSAYKDIAAAAKPTAVPINKKWPLFIVGCPRSGTTLLAQMLDRHSQVKSEGELGLVNRIFLEMQASIGQKKSFADFIKYLWLEADPQWIKKWSDRFFEMIADLSASKMGLWVVDKMPDNALALGILGRIAPGAAIIHLVRDGREVAMSCFRQNFAVYHWHAHDLTQGIHHWVDTHEVVSAAAMLNLNLKEVLYEKLVDNAQGVLADLLKFLGLPWEDSCLNFHETTTVARTASYEQVRQKLNRQGLDFCKKNYPEQYGMMTRIAEGKLRQLGYAL